MDGLLSVKAIVIKIAGNLNTVDFLHFKQVNKSVYHKQLDEDATINYFSAKLRHMGLVYEVASPRRPETGDSLFRTGSVEEDIQFDDLTPVNAFEKLRTFNRENCIRRYKWLHKMFAGYCLKLASNNLANFFPQEYANDPLLQSKIMQNIRLYNESHVNDRAYYEKISTNFEILREIFTNSCLNEMELNYKEKDYETVGKFIEILLLSDETSIAVDFFNSKVEYPVPTLQGNPVLSIAKEDGEEDNKEAEKEVRDSTSTTKKIINKRYLEEIFSPLNSFLNEYIRVIDTLFGDKYQIVMSFYETFIQQTLLPVIDQLHPENTGENDDYDESLDSFPLLYSELMTYFCTNIIKSKNGNIRQPSEEKLSGEDSTDVFHIKLRDLLNVYLIPKILNYLDQSTIQFQRNIIKQFDNFEQEQKNIVKTDLINTDTDTFAAASGESNEEEVTNKYNFLDSFTKVFKKTTKTSKASQLKDNLNNLVNSNLRNIKNLINLELCLNVVQQAHDKINTFLEFNSIQTIAPTINEKCENLFKIMIKSMNEHHVKPAFEKAIDLLQSYDSSNLDSEEVDIQSTPEETQEKQSLQPLVNFAELINIGDIILQMISIFYNSELVGKNIIDSKSPSKNNIWQNELIQSKREFELTLDNYVADGLNIGINKLIDKIYHVFKTTQLPTDYYPPPSKKLTEIKPTRCCQITLMVLQNHCFLLNGATDKGTVDVYQQEIAKRFFNELVEQIKSQVISTEGAVTLICDLNQYFDFFSKKLKQISIVPYFQSLKNVGNLFLIDGKDSKELGKLIGDLNQFQGVFSQEEIYEFVQRRQDWVLVKRDVEKAMYGLGIKDCVIM